MTNDRWKIMLRRLWPAVKAALILAVLGALGYGFLFAPTPVLPHVVNEGGIVSEVMGTGTLDPHVKATISTKISGRLVSLLVDEGDQVQKGDEVARLDDQDLKHQVEIEEANVTARKANVERLIADKAYSKSLLDLSSNNYLRAKKLLASKATSPEDYDRAVEAFNSAQASIERADAALEEGRKQLIAMEKTLEFHQARLADTVITAPFSGLVVRRDRDPGDVVVPGSSILSLVAPDELWVRAWVDETNIANLSVGQPARIVFRSEPDRSYRGEVVRLGRETDRETREFLVDVHPETLPKNWTVGQRAEVYIETARKSNATLIPANSIVWRDGLAGVFVAVNDRARWRELTLGLRGGDSVEVLKGLAPGEVVVRPAQAKTAMTDGQRITMP